MHSLHPRVSLWTIERKHKNNLLHRDKIRRGRIPFADGQKLRYDTFHLQFSIGRKNL